MFGKDHYLEVLLIIFKINKMLFLISVLIVTIILLVLIILIQRSKLGKIEGQSFSLMKSVKKQENPEEKFDFKAAFDGNSGLISIPYNIAKLMVQKYVNGDNYLPRSVYFYGKNFEELKNYLSDETIKGIKVYFGRYYKDSTTSDRSVYDYLRKLYNESEADRLLSMASNHVTVILAVTNENGEIDVNKLINLGGLCPPKCIPGSYGTGNDPLFD
ncbi:MAG: hypothetical protein WBO44_15690 [Saprospiraceae bacterium]